VAARPDLLRPSLATVHVAKHGEEKLVRKIPTFRKMSHEKEPSVPSHIQAVTIHTSGR